MAMVRYTADESLPGVMEFLPLLHECPLETIRRILLPTIKARNCSV